METWQKLLPKRKKSGVNSLKRLASQLTLTKSSWVLNLLVFSYSPTVITWLLSLFSINIFVEIVLMRFTLWYIEFKPNTRLADRSRRFVIQIDRYNRSILVNSFLATSRLWNFLWDSCFAVTFFKDLSATSNAIYWLFKKSFSFCTLYSLTPFSVCTIHFSLCTLVALSPCMGVRRLKGEF